MDLRQAQQRLTTDLKTIYDTREAATIADWVMEHLTGLKKLDRLVAATNLSDAALKQYDVCRNELLAHRPVQYVLQESWFAGLRLYVNERVLIPRPETEELVEWVVASIASASSATLPAKARSVLPDALLDVGTGSGCIPVSIARRLPQLPIHACDISESALDVARRNAGEHQAGVTFHLIDFLDRGTWSSLPPIRWLVSNPPYIPLRERPSMPRHVAEAEPSLALFVPDADPLVFYRALGVFARERLLPNGAVFVETHEDLAADVAGLFTAAGLGEIVIRKDMQGKERMVGAKSPPGPQNSM
ncbi:MAG TPA: peptide chain release factor N(5)-glutamine methyltransferase [Puia sp.]|nr:peptide chain release factor N(5)-glutamine methyltransferase [Puia sp.]